jgi:hypothetical protein
LLVLITQIYHDVRSTECEKLLPFVFFFFFFFFWKRFTALTGSYRRFETTYRSHIQGSSSLKLLCRSFGKPIDPICKNQTVLDCVTKVLEQTGSSETSVTTNKRCVTPQKNAAHLHRSGNLQQARTWLDEQRHGGRTVSTC